MTTRPDSILRSPAIASMSSLWPLPSTPAMPDDLARAHVEGDAAHGLEPALVAHLQVLDLEQRLTRLRRRPLVDAQQHLAPDHERREAVLGRALARHGLDRLAAPQDRDRGRRSSSTSWSLWVMKMIDLPSRLERAQDREQLVRLLRRQHGRRLVEDEDVGAAVERLQDLDALLLADARSTRSSRRAARRGRSACEMSRTRSRRVVACSMNGPASSARSPRTMFSATVITGMSMKCWCTMPIPRSIASLRRADPHRLAAHAGSRPRPGGRARRGCSSASTCRRRSRRGARAPRRRGARSRP